MLWLRITFVWIATVIGTTLIVGRGAYFMAFMLLGFFGTVPAIFILYMLAEIENFLKSKNLQLAASATGIVMGIIIPIVYDFSLPNNGNSHDLTFFYLGIGIGMGCLWSLTSFRTTASENRD
jgi:hypothetical protein